MILRTYTIVIIQLITICNLYSFRQNCTFTVTPDLELLSSSNAIDNEILLTYKRFSDDYLGKTPPSSASLNSAINSYDNLNISIINNDVFGNNINSLKDLMFLKVFASHLKFKNNDSDIKERVNKVIWLAYKQICNNQLNVDVRGYDYRFFGRAVVLMKDFLTTESKRMFEYTLYKTTSNFKHYWESDYESAQLYNDAINTDQIYTKSDILMAYSSWQNTPEERYRYMRAFKRYMNRFFTFSSGTANGIKPDGSSFHHWTAYNNYMYAFNTACKNVCYLRDTSFQVDTNNYMNFRDAVLVHLLQANDYGVHALSVSGRKPDSKETTVSISNVSRLAIAGGKILNLSNADPVLAGFVNRVDGINSDFNYNSIQPFEEGFIQINYANAGFYRKNNWVAVNKGFTNGLWGTETYKNNNRYGRYQSYGALEIIYPGDKKTGNGYNDKTWNWNFNPGTTVINLPWNKLHSERERIDELQEKSFVGSLTFSNNNSTFLKNTFGSYGMFAMDFKEKENEGFGTTHSSNNHNGSFTFKKSSFYFDDIIICLASNISNNDFTNKTVTTLFQRLDNKNLKVNINGSTFNSIGENSSEGVNQNNWLISNYNTGFYLISDNYQLKVKKENKATPNHNQIWPVNISNNSSETYFTGYLDHGTSPNNKNYEYIIIPNSSLSRMQQLDNNIKTDKKPYKVHQKDSNAHIIEYHSKNTFAYANFNSISNLTFGKIKSISSPSLLMIQENNNSLKIAISNPDLDIESRKYDPVKNKIIDITVEGKWFLNTNVSNVTILSRNNIKTKIQVELEKGLPKEFILDASTLGIKKEEDVLKNIKVYPNPVKNKITINSLSNFSEIELFNINGRKIINHQFKKQNNFNFYTHNLNTGIYFLSIKIDGKKFIKKIIKL